MNEIKHILDLPDEVLRIIFGHLPAKQQFDLGQLCRRFYEVSCSITDCKLEINAKNEYNIYSIINSMRKVTKVTFEKPGPSIRINASSKGSIKGMNQNLAIVFKKYREGIKDVRMNGLNVTFKEISLLNYAHDLHSLQISKLKLSEDIPGNFKLNLSKLKILSIENCDEKLLEVFDSLPDDVLTELRLEYIRHESDEEYFENQKKIKSLRANTHLIDYSKHVELEFLDLSSCDFTSDKALVNTDLLNMICERLGKLKELKIKVKNEYIDFSGIQKLRNLKKFEIEKDKNDFDVGELRTLRSRTIEEMYVRGYELTGVENINSGCPNIRKLHLDGDEPYSSIVNRILLHFPKLESFLIENMRLFEPTEVINGFEHENLKELSVITHRPFVNVIADIVTCSILERASLDLLAIDKSFKKFIANQPSLKFLFVYYPEEIIPEFDILFIKNIARYARKLDEIVFAQCDKFNPIFSVLQKRFPVVEIKKEERQIVFKKN